MSNTLPLFVAVLLLVFLLILFFYYTSSIFGNRVTKTNPTNLLAEATAGLPLVRVTLEPRRLLSWGEPLPKTYSTSAVKYCPLPSQYKGWPSFAKGDQIANLTHELMIVSKKKDILASNSIWLSDLFNSISESMLGLPGGFAGGVMLPLPAYTQRNIEGVAPISTQCLSAPEGTKNPTLLGYDNPAYAQAGILSLCSSSQKKKLDGLQEKISKGIGTIEGIALYTTGYHKDFLLIEQPAMESLHRTNIALYNEIMKCGIPVNFSNTTVDKCSKKEKAKGWYTVHATVGSGSNDFCLDGNKVLNMLVNYEILQLKNLSDNFGLPIVKLRKQYEARIKAIEDQLKVLEL